MVLPFPDDEALYPNTGRIFITVAVLMVKIEQDTRLPPLGSHVVGDIVWTGVVVGAFDVVWRTVLLS
jgi:hypothetical protein